MPPPVVTAELADRLERAEAEYMASDMSALRTDDDNPLGVDVEHFGDATALAMTELDYWEFNRTIGLRDHGPDEIDAVLGWYRERRVDCRFDVAPMLCTERVRLTLAERGFHQSGFHTVLYGEPSPSRTAAVASVDVVEVGSGDMEVFADLYMVYYDDLNLPLDLRRRAKTNVEARHPLPGWRLYVATVDGEPAAFGALFVSGGVASLGRRRHGAPLSRPRLPVGPDPPPDSRRRGRGLRPDRRPGGAGLVQPAQHGARRPPRRLHQGRLVALTVKVPAACMRAAARRSRGDGNPSPHPGLWVPAFAGMTVVGCQPWNEVGCARHPSFPWRREPIPAPPPLDSGPRLHKGRLLAGMTVVGCQPWNEVGCAAARRSRGDGNPSPRPHPWIPARVFTRAGSWPE